MQQRHLYTVADTNFHKIRAVQGRRRYNTRECRNHIHLWIACNIFMRLVAFSLNPSRVLFWSNGCPSLSHRTFFPRSHADAVIYDALIPFLRPIRTLTACARESWNIWKKISPTLLYVCTLRHTCHLLWFIGASVWVRGNCIVRPAARVLVRKRSRSSRGFIWPKRCAVIYWSDVHTESSEAEFANTLYG